MKALTYLITFCLLIISSQVFSQNICDSGFLSGEVSNETDCASLDGAIDITLTGGVAPFTFSWSGPNIFGATTEDLTDLMAGTYSVVVTDANGEACVGWFEVVGAGPICTANVVSPDCNGNTGLIEIACVNGTPPYTYTWSNGVNGPIIQNIPVGTYAITVTDANGCEWIEIYTVNNDSGAFCDTVYIDPVQVTTGNQIQVDFVVNDFDIISSMQYTIQYDPTVLQYESISNFSPSMTGLDISSFNPSNPGYITHSWAMGTFVSLPDGTVLYSAFFTPLTTEESEIFINGIPTPIEVSNGNFQFVYLGSTPETILVEGNILSGSIYKDGNSNCQNDGEQTLSTWPINITNGVEEWNLVTDADGYYSIVVSDGTYEINVTPPNENWDICNNNVSIDVSEFVALDFGATALVECPVMEVDLAIPLLIRCFESDMFISYCNYGTIDAIDAYVEIELDPEMTFVSADITPVNINGNLITFDLGDIAIGECGDFKMTVLVDDNCDSSVLGQTHCTTATIYPNQPCGADPLWGGASLELTANCDGTNVNFVIENVGTGGMDQPSSFIVIEDHVMGQSIPEDFVLASGESLTITKPANGSTYYMSVNQVPYHPGNSHPAVAVEGCGTNDDGGISLGVVTQYSQNDNDGFVDIECVQNVGSYDPNDKKAMLDGFGDENLIYANTPMEYMIRFQNTGTFTAFNVVVKDELSPFFDITTLRPGASSHDYTFSIEDERTIVFTFENINLPDSTTDLSGSNGFLTYKVDQLLDNPDGTVLENTAEIYFDFNEAIITNTTVHTIGSDFITTSTFFDDELNTENSIAVYPNPSDDIMTFELEEWNNNNIQLEVFDLTGKLISTQIFDNEKVVLSKSALKEGMFFYSITSSGNVLTSGKFIFL